MDELGCEQRCVVDKVNREPAAVRLYHLRRTVHFLHGEVSYTVLLGDLVSLESDQFVDYVLRLRDEEAGENAWLFL